MTNKNIKKSIVELLSKKALNITEISAELQIPKDNLKAYLSTLFKENKVKRITEKKPYKYAAVNNGLEIDTQILKKLIPLFFESGIRADLEQSEIERIKEIAEGL